MPQPPASPVQTPSPAARRGATTSMRPLAAAEFGYDQARHLLWRAGFGGTPEQIRLLASWGPTKAVDHLLDADKVEFAEVTLDQFKDDIIRPYTPDEQRILQLARRSQDEDSLARIRLARMEREREDRRQMRDMQRWWLTGLIESPRPLEEKMTLFWHGHFATSYRTIEDSYHMFLQNRMFRANALGSFSSLLRAIIRDPAMLAYLNNNTSRKEKPNENLAREIMELFSLGVGGYTEADIKEGARALTGYSFNDDRFVFQQANHDPNPKTILGQRGRFNGEDFVRIILSRPACARYIARQIYKFLAVDIPPLEATNGDRDLDQVTRIVIDDLASTLRGSSYELKPMLKRLLLSEHFYSPPVMGQQIKSPVMLIVGAIRSLNTPPRDLSVLLDAMDLMGQELFYPPSVKGWDGGRSWINTSTLFIRQNALAFLLTGRRPKGTDPLAEKEKFDPMPLLSELDRGGGDTFSDPDKVAEVLLRLTLGSVPSGAKDALIAYAASRGPTVNRDTIVGMLLIITSMPEYQLC